MSHLGSIQRGLGLGLGYKLMYEDGQLAHLGYDLILFFLHFFYFFFPPFLFAFILSVINHSKGDSMDHIAQFQVMKPHQ